MADTIRTIKSSGGDYTSLEAWEAGQQKSIAVGDREIAECYAFSDSTTANVIIGGWTVPSGAEIIVRTPLAERHSFKRGTGYRLVSSSLYWVLNITNNYVTLDGIAFRGTNTSTGGGGQTMRCNSIQNLRILNCFIESDLPDGEALRVGVFDAANRDAVVVNTVVIKNNASATSYAVGIGGEVTLSNCVLVHMGNAEALYTYNTGNNAHRVKNCYLHRATGTNVYAAGYGFATFTTCKHSTSQSITGSTGSTAYSTANFTSVTAGSEDHHPVGGSALIDAGTDLSADGDYAFDYDGEGNTRSGTWEIGPFNYAAAAVASLPPHRTQARRIAPLLGF